MNTTNHTITFDLDGSAHCLWTEAVPLHELGQLDIHRASQIEFNPLSQEWEVRLESNPTAVAFSHVSRSVCLCWEREHIDPTD